MSLLPHALVTGAALLSCIWRVGETTPRLAYGVFVDGLLLLPLLVALSVRTL